MVENNNSEISREKQQSLEKSKDSWWLANEGDVFMIDIYHPREGAVSRKFVVPWDVRIEIKQEKDYKKKIKNISKTEKIAFTQGERELLRNKTHIGLGRVDKIFKKMDDDVNKEEEIFSLKLDLGDFDVVNKGDKIKLFLPLHRNEWRHAQPPSRKIS